MYIVIILFVTFRQAIYHYVPEAFHVFGCIVLLLYSINNLCYMYCYLCYCEMYLYVEKMILCSVGSLYRCVQPVS